MRKDVKMLKGHYRIGLILLFVSLILTVSPLKVFADCTRQFRGDANSDQQIDISDGVFILNWLFLGTAEPDCPDSADVNADGNIDISDPVYLLTYLFLDSTKPPPPPFPDPAAAPVLPLINDQMVKVGSNLTIDIPVRDPNLDPVSVMMKPLPLPSGARLRRVSPNLYRFTFRPTPAQVGDIALTLNASDGRLTASHPFNISVFGVEPGDPTRLMGRLLDTNDYVQGLETPIMGAVVSFLGTGFSAVSDPDGYFNLDLTGLTSEDQILDIAPADGLGGQIYAGFRERLTVILETDNVIDRPFFLPQIDPFGTAQVDPDTTTMVMNERLDIMVEVPAHTAKNADGTDFSGMLSISEVEEGLAPAAMPEEFDPAQLITIQPVGVSYAQPVPITFPNLDQLPAGSELDLWSIDPDQGIFVIVGRGRVTDDELSIETIEGGIRANDWHFVSPAPPVVDLAGDTGSNSGNQDKDKCSDLGDPGADSSTCWGSGVAVSSGTLSEAHRLAGYRIQGQGRSLKFNYDSSAADPRPIIGVTATVPAVLPVTLSTRLDIGSVDVEDEVFTSIADLAGGDQIRLARQFAAEALPTGDYPYTLQIIGNFRAARVSTFLRGDFLLTNESGSNFGAGWTLDDLDRVGMNSIGEAVMSFGDGSIKKFTRQPAIINTFAEDREGWRAWSSASGLYGVSYNAPSEEDLGFVCAEDRDGRSVFLHASEIFEGDKQTFYDGFLRYDLRLTGGMSTANSTSDVVIEGSGMTITHDYGDITQNPTSQWRTYTVPLNENAWVLSDGNGLQPVTRAQMRQVLSSIDFIRLLGEYVLGQNELICVRAPSLLLPAGQAEEFDSPSGDYSRLARQDDGAFTRTLKNGTRIHFNADGLQTAVIDRNGRTTEFEYDADQRLETIRDPKGFETVFAYGADGKLETVTDPAGRSTGFTIDGNGDLRSITDPDGSIRLFEYDDRHRIIRKTTKQGHDTLYGWNFAGRNISVLRADGSERFMDPVQIKGLADMASGEGTAANPAVPARVEDVFAEYTDGRGNTTRFSVDSYGAATVIIDALDRQTMTERDEHANPTLITRPNGAVTRLTYDTKGNLLTLNQEGIGAQTVLTYEPVFNQVRTIQDPEGHLTTINYDAQGNPEQITDDAGTLTRLRYEDANCPGQVTRITAAEGVAGLENSTHFTYFPDTCNLQTVTDSLDRVTAFTYDPLTGNTRTVTDGEDAVTTFTYDAMNRLDTVRDSLDQVTDYDYDDAGNLRFVRDANNQVSEFRYDEADRLAGAVDPLNRIERYRYDGNGNLVSVTDRKNQTVQFVYDSINRLEEKHLPAAGGLPPEVVNYMYDELDNLTLAEDADSRLGFVYDDYSRLEEVTQTLHPSAPEPLTQTLNYTYDLNGQRRTLQFIDALNPLTLTYVYDNLNRIDTITQQDGPVFGFDYDVLSRRSLLTMPNGTTVNYDYDIASQLTSISHLDTNDQILSTFGYPLYDGVGNRTAVSSQRSAVGGINEDLSYDYDSLYRLTVATNPLAGQPAEHFEYDPLGNRLRKAGQAVESSFNMANQLVNDTEFEYTYDNNGNLQTKRNLTTLSLTTYHWDAEDQLIRIDFPEGGSAQYSYDALGRRIQKNVDGVVTRYVYDSEDIIFEFDGDNNLLARYTHGVGIDEPLMMERDLDVNGSFEASERFFYHTDGLGSVTDLTDNTGSVVRSYVYDSFGHIVSEVGSLINPYAYTGRERDEESGLYFYRARYYDSVVGRFLSEDPLGLLGGMNRYSYTFNNPIIFVDAFGLRGNFGDNFRFALRANKDFFFGEIGGVSRTAIGAYTAGKVARSTGLRTVGMALSEFARNQRMFAPHLGMTSLGVAASLGGSFVVNGAVNAAFVGFSAGGGVIVGSLLDATFQTFFVEDEEVKELDICEE